MALESTITSSGIGLPIISLCVRQAEVPNSALKLLGLPSPVLDNDLSVLILRLSAPDTIITFFASCNCPVLAIASPCIRSIPFSSSPVEPLFILPFLPQWTTGVESARRRPVTKPVPAREFLMPNLRGDSEVGLGSGEGSGVADFHCPPGSRSMPAAQLVVVAVERLGVGVFPSRFEC